MPSTVERTFDTQVGSWLTKNLEDVFHGVGGMSKSGEAVLWSLEGNFRVGDSEWVSHVRQLHPVIRVWCDLDGTTQAKLSDHERKQYFLQVGYDAFFVGNKINNVRIRSAFPGPTSLLGDTKTTLPFCKNNRPGTIRCLRWTEVLGRKQRLRNSAKRALGRCIH